MSGSIVIAEDASLLELEVKRKLILGQFRQIPKRNFWHRCKIFFSGFQYKFWFLDRNTLPVHTYSYQQRHGFSNNSDFGQSDSEQSRDQNNEKRQGRNYIKGITIVYVYILLDTL